MKTFYFIMAMFQFGVAITNLFLGKHDLMLASTTLALLFQVLYEIRERSERPIFIRIQTNGNNND